MLGMRRIRSLLLVGFSYGRIKDCRSVSLGLEDDWNVLWAFCFPLCRLREEMRSNREGFELEVRIKKGLKSERRRTKEEKRRSRVWGR